MKYSWETQKTVSIAIVRQDKNKQFGIITSRPPPAKTHKTATQNGQNTRTRLRHWFLREPGCHKNVDVLLHRQSGKSTGIGGVIRLIKGTHAHA